ncbi:MAG: peptide-methionine (S)-S-oxide reductase MsrA [Candidatus Thorarchaeota archaeon]|jgi:peptide-methionine (S)-S-oxide reductase
METTTLAAGCFWCVEAVYQQLKGVNSVVSGYSGGHVENPSYKQVSTGTTGHAEVCHIEFNPDQITFDELLEVFFETHDPTTLNRQGNDIGTQYRSAIFYHNDAQKEAAERFIDKINASGAWKNPVVTEIVPFTKFYRAEDYHQNYFRNNPNQQYCRLVIKPKLDKFEKVFKLKLS